MPRYKQAYDGEWIRPEHHGFKLACCDCGVVHTVNFRIRNKGVEMQPTRDAKATARFRKKKAALPK